LIHDYSFNFYHHDCENPHALGVGGWFLPRAM
jgi:hypothetical protein